MQGERYKSSDILCANNENIAIDARLYSFDEEFFVNFSTKIYII